MVLRKDSGQRKCLMYFYVVEEELFYSKIDVM